MGWHKKSLSKNNSSHETVKADNTKDDSFKNEQNIIKAATTMNTGKKLQTLLAKALYDNLADAPDELNFRKGDIVTVIEQDVDGIIGWWLCLLHGRQGIVPGNRLKIIPPVELDQLEKDSMKKGSNDSKVILDKRDFVDGMVGDNYDYLPAPTKANPFPLPLSIKDMFDIPYKTDISILGEVYDIPSPQTEEIQNKSKNDERLGYSTPTNNRHSGERQEIYDTPTNRRNSASHGVNDKPTKQSITPKACNLSRCKRLSGPLDVYDIPTNNRLSGSHEVYDTPINQRLSGSHEVYDVPTNNRLSGSHENYDVPNTKTTQSVTPQQEIYDVPSSSIIHNTPVKSLTSADISKSGSVLEMEKLMGEFYDSPFNANSTSISTIKRSPRNSHNNTPRNSMNATVYQTDKSESSEIYDVPASSSFDFSNHQQEEILGIVNTLSGQGLNRGDALSDSETSVKRVFEETYDIPAASKTLKRGPKKSQENLRNAQTLPRGFSPKKNSQQQSKGNFLQEIYDIPGTINRSTHSSGFNTSVADEANNKVKTSVSNTKPSEEVYDIPPGNTLQRKPESEARKIKVEKTYNDELYDIPVHHNVNQVLANAAGARAGGNAYDKHPPGGNKRLTGKSLIPPGMLEDDYVDYHDIWSKEPPKDLVRQHADSISKREDLQPPLSPTSRRRLSSEQKKSILDQINFEAVKELQITTSEALERLSKLHLAVDTCVTTLSSFCNEKWLDIPTLKTTVQRIRDFSGKLKTALRLLTEFGLGTLVNTTKNIRGEMLMDKLIEDVEPLLESYYKIKICLMHLDSNNWSVPDVRTSANDKFFATLNAIMILSQRIPDQCRSFNLAVHNNIEELFTADPVRSITKPMETLVTKVQQNTPPPPNVHDRSGGKISNTESPSETHQRELAVRRQQARDVNSGTLTRPVPRLPPKPTLPSQRRSLAGTMEPPESPRLATFCNRGFGHIERLVTEYVPENIRQKKYASDPATPSYSEGQKSLWGGSCPVLLERNSAAAYSPLRGADSTSSSSSVGASIPEETIEIKQTNQINSDMNRSFPSDSNILSPSLSPMHTRSASLPWDDKKRSFSYDDPNTKSLSTLDHRDIESLEFFCRQVESQVMLLRESMKNLTEAVENREEPVVFVSHSKFIILTAHKVVNGGQEITGRLLNRDVQSRIKSGTMHLTICIRGVVAATKTAALEYPEASAMMEMISSVLALGDAVRIIHSDCRRALDA